MWAQWSGGRFQQCWQWRERQGMFRMVIQLLYYKVKSIPMCSFMQISRLQIVYGAEYWPQNTGNNDGNVELLQNLHWNVQIVGACSHRNRKNNICLFDRTYWAKTSEGNSFVDHIITGDKVSPLQAGLKTAVHQVAIYEFPIKEVAEDAALIGKVMHTIMVLFLDFLEPRQTSSETTSQHWLNWKIKFSELGQRRRQSFFFLQHQKARPHIGSKTVEHLINLV